VIASRLFHRIVVPTDFSACSEDAWALARRIAGAVGSEIVLVHVFVEPPSYAEPSLSVNSAWQVIESARKWVEETLEKWADAAREKGISVRTLVRTGSPYQEIVDLATDERADLVAMGTHGRSGVNRFLLGSVADRVIRLAPCPVLTVRQPE
jgi:nucleotide-binding universal stress UspA family protein